MFAIIGPALIPPWGSNDYYGWYGDSSQYGRSDGDEYEDGAEGEKEHDTQQVDNNKGGVYHYDIIIHRN